jgi:hypothetical protein
MKTRVKLDDFYLAQPEPFKSCLLALRDIILSYDPDLTNVLKYNYPFFCYNGKTVCYLSIDKKRQQPYMGFVEGYRLDHPKLLAEKRTRIKIMLFDAKKDLPVKAINAVLKMAMNSNRKNNYKTGKV